MYDILDPYDRTDKRTARQGFNALMEAKAERIASLTARLVEEGIELGDTPAHVDALESWLVTNAAPSTGRGHLGPDRKWTSVCHDVGLYVGDLLIARHPILHWAFLDVGPRYTERFSAAVLGFPVKNKWYGPAFPLEIEGHVVAFMNMQASGELLDYMYHYLNVRLRHFDELAQGDQLVK